MKYKECDCYYHPGKKRRKRNKEDKKRVWFIAKKKPQTNKKPTKQKKPRKYHITGLLRVNEVVA